MSAGGGGGERRGAVAVAALKGRHDGVQLLLLRDILQFAKFSLIFLALFPFSLIFLALALFFLSLFPLLICCSFKWKSGQTLVLQFSALLRCSSSFLHFLLHTGQWFVSIWSSSESS